MRADDGAYGLNSHVYLPKLFLHLFDKLLRFRFAVRLHDEYFIFIQLRSLLLHIIEQGGKGKLHSLFLFDVEDFPFLIEIKNRFNAKQVTKHLRRA